MKLMSIAFGLVVFFLAGSAHELPGTAQERISQLEDGRKPPPPSCDGANLLLPKLQGGDLTLVSEAIRFRRLHCYGGGLLEDVDIALGEVFFRNPSESIILFTKNNVNDTEAEDVLTSIPWKYVDNPCNLEQEFERRKSIILALGGSSFDKARVVKNIDSALEDIRLACKESSDK